MLCLTAIHVDEGRKIVISKDDLEGMLYFYYFSPFACIPGFQQFILEHSFKRNPPTE